MLFGVGQQRRGPALLLVCLASLASEATGWQALPQLIALGRGLRSACLSSRGLCMDSGASSPGGGAGGSAGKGMLSRREAGAAIAGASIAAAGAGEAGAAGKKKLQPVVATDRQMAVVKVTSWVKKHPKAGARDLVVGLGGEPYWLIAGKEGSVESYALRAECTHLGCLADYRPELTKYVCPCHGSEYDKEGRVLRGPAPRALDLAKVEVLEDGTVQISEWDMKDFRAAGGDAKA